MKNVVSFLRESNAIEGIFDDEALLHAKISWNFLSRFKHIDAAAINFAHLCLMQPFDLESKYKGAFRREPVWIGGHEGKPWYVVPELIDQWCRVANRKPRTEGEIISDHVFFENVHPYIDGNGRIGRMLYNWERLRNGFDLQVIKNKDKSHYYSWFERDI